MPALRSTIRFERLESIDPHELLVHMRDPRIAKHLPLLRSGWDQATVDAFISRKAEHWAEHGLGHWAILLDEEYVGWGGFEKEGPEWDFGLVLRPEYFNWGRRIARRAFEWALENTDIEAVTFLLPVTRAQDAPRKLGAQLVGQTNLSGTIFRKWHLPLRPGRI